MRKTFKIISPLLRPVYKLYAKFPHTYNFRGLKISVRPGVFDPILFHSTIDLINYVEESEFQGHKMLELGCGSAMASVYFSTKNWQCSAVDISTRALDNAKYNAERNNAEVELIKSDLFSELQERSFDVVFVNPPYFPQQVNSESDAAWFCGRDFEYYDKLFGHMKKRDFQEEMILMVLSDQCDTDRISALSSKSGLNMKLVREIHHSYENILIYQFEKLSPQ